MDSIERELQNLFPKSSAEDWNEVAMRETNGKKPFEFLSWRGKDKILFLPYYDTETEPPLNFQLPPSNASFLRSWNNIAAIKVVHEQTSNTTALEHLMQGADGVLFDTRSTPNPDVNTLTSNIEWPSCSIQFYTSHAELSIALSDHLRKNSIPPVSVRGALFWETIPKKSNLNFYFENCENFQALGLLIHESSPAEEISNALFSGVTAFEIFSNLSDRQKVFRSIAFSLSADPAMFECIAKFKALRMLWFQVAQAYSINDYKVGDVQLHARTDVVPDGTFGPHENMLRGTFSAMAAIIGGCNSISLTPAGEAPFQSRWARNVSPILLDEAFFGKVADPLAGAAALDAITRALALKGWNLFQEKWKTYEAT